jgi:EmrB/QacA subfamily drug resistance transporter
MKEHAKHWWLLALLALAQFMVVLDVSIMNVALPSVQKSLDISLSQLQWIVSTYTLAFGGFLLLGGRAADLYGRRRVFVSGVFGFAAVSLMVGIAQSDLQMIVLRGLQGFCAAFMSPSALSIVLATFREPHERARALSIWGMVAAGGGAAGVLLGGILTQYLSWRWNFFINVPVGVLVGFFALRLAPAHESEEANKALDIPGAALITSAMILLVYTLTEANTWGWASALTLGCLAAVAALILAFIYNESRVARPLVPLSVFRIGNIAAADLTQLPVTASLFAMFFFVSLYVQTVLDFSPIKSGLSFLPVPLIIAISAMLAPRVIARIGYKPILVVAPWLLAGGLFILAHVPVDGSYYADVLPGISLIAIGMGFSFVSLTIAATTGIPGHFSGLASGLLNTAQQIGGALGLAILSSVAASTTSTYLAAHPGVPAPALVEGFHAAFYTAIIFSALASLSALLFLRSHRGGAIAAPAPSLH